ncbi:tripartite tricarboxylate transporter TctB family protein [Savagea faecisuis]|uniref:Tripartite tricarboxylate transporter TctB family protein n=1 Tax=Savagea faecisuis TaxID=1274803 RepID=A0ABW3H0G4_9BACL
MVNTTDRKISIVLFLFALLYLFLSYQLPNFEYALIDSDILPKGLGFLLIVLSIILFIQNKEESEAEKIKRQIKKEDLILLIATIVSLLAYVTLFEILGFVVTTILFLVITMRMYGYSNWKISMVVSITFTFVLYFSFNYILKIYLPQGILPF